MAERKKCNYFKIKTSRHPFHKVLFYCGWLRLRTPTTSQLFSCATGEKRGLKKLYVAARTAAWLNAETIWHC